MPACVIVLHHTGKGESTRDYRGSSDFKASLDVGYTLANFGEHRLERMRLKAFKTRFRTDTDVILNYREGEFIADTSGSAVTKSISAQLTALLRVNPEITTTKFEELAAARGLGRNQAREYLSSGVAVGEIRETKGMKNARRYSSANRRRKLMILRLPTSCSPVSTLMGGDDWRTGSSPVCLDCGGELANT